MTKWLSFLLVAMTASVLTLLGSSLVASGGGSHAAQPRPCGITVDNPCPVEPLLKVSAPSMRPNMTLTKGKYLVWLDGHAVVRQMDHGSYHLTGCVLYREQHSPFEAVVLDPFRGAGPFATDDVDNYSALQKVVERLREKHQPIFASTPPASLPILVPDLHFRLPYQPVLVEVPAPAKPGVQPPIAPGPKVSTPQVATLTATCRVRIPKTPRGVDVASARIYALRLE